MPIAKSDETANPPLSLMTVSMTVSVPAAGVDAVTVVLQVVDPPMPDTENI
jgi:hypothetical protein